MLTTDCFKQICMQSRSKKADQVRLYFLEVERVLLKHREDMVRGMEMRMEAMANNQKPGKKGRTPTSGFIYVFRASDRNTNVYKLGRVVSWKRIKDHESSHADDIDVLFVYETTDIKAVETCAKAFLRDKQY